MPSKGLITRSPTKEDKVHEEKMMKTFAKLCAFVMFCVRTKILQSNRAPIASGFEVAITMETLLQIFGSVYANYSTVPSSTSLAIISMALGIGANTAIFSLSIPSRSRPLPVRNAVRTPGTLRHPAQWRRLHPPVLSELQGLPRSQSGLLRLARLSHRRRQPEPQRQQRARLGHDGLRKLLRCPRRAAPSRSRLSPGGRSNPESHPVVVLSYGCWQKRFGSDPAIIGAPSW